jgi:phage tail-like protein
VADDAFNGQRVSAATFLFEVDGETIGHFMEVSGLSAEVTVENVEEGGENGFTHRLPGRMTWPNITLKRGVTQSDNLLTWFNKSSGEQFASSNNTLTRSSAAITLLGPNNARLRSWNFIDAFPVKWTGPEFAASSTNAATESLEIAHHGFRATTN